MEFNRKLFPVQIPSILLGGLMGAGLFWPHIAHTWTMLLGGYFCSGGWFFEFLKNHWFEFIRFHFFEKRKKIQRITGHNSFKHLKEP
jgi:hypothetical protein